MPSGRLIIHAINVHQGGGLALLLPLLEALPEDLEVVAALDSRLQERKLVPGNINTRWVKPTIQERLKAEWWLARNARADDRVLCFGNLPPIFRVQGSVQVFLQNRYLIEPFSLAAFSCKTRLKIGLERLWLASRAEQVTAFIVQTPSMQRSLRSSGIAKNKPIRIFPFVSESEGYRRTGKDSHPHATNRFDFLYVASGEPHKNHKTLVQAWSLLASEGLFPTLCLTLDEKTTLPLIHWINQQKSAHKLRIENQGSLPHQGVKRLYRETQALIYPSSFESLGLPLIEARQAGLPVLAPELDYVRDVLDPEQTFDPHSPTSIARAVKRFLRVEENPLPLQSAREFIDRALVQAQ